MDAFIKDIRYALRQLRKSPGFTLTAVLTLALGIGANTAIFTLVNGILLRQLPVANRSLLYRIGDVGECCVEGGYPGDAPNTGDFSIFSYPLYKYLQQNTPEFEQLAAAQAGFASLSVRRNEALPKPLGGEFVSGNYFATFGLSAFQGRVFSESDDTPSSAPVAVLNYNTWKTEFNADPSIVGSTVFIQAKPFTVAGIAPPGFFGDRVTSRPPDIWMPLETEPYLRGSRAILHHENSHWLYPIGRVRPGTDIGALQSKISIELRHWLSARKNYTSNGRSVLIPRQHVVLAPAGGGVQNMQQQTGKGLKLLMLLSMVVLLIACANIANLLLARNAARRPELAVRVALGANRFRLIRQVITESVLLSCIGGLAGLLVAYAGSRTILSLAFPDVRNLPVDANPSLAVLGFAFLISLITGVLFGTVPAWLSTHAQPAEALHGVNRTTRDRSTLPQKTLVIFQAALSLVLLASAVLMARSLANLEHQNFGITTHNRYVVHLDPAGAGYSAERLPALYREMEERFSSLPGISHVAMALYSPLEGNNWGECVIPQGHATPGPNENCGSTWDRVSWPFLRTIGVTIVRGRDFNEHDTATSPQVAVVNQAFVKRFFPNQDPIGKRFGMDFVENSNAFEIVGVFQDFKINNPRSAVRPVFLRPLTQQYVSYKRSQMLTVVAQSMYINSILVDFNRPPQNVDTLMRRTLAGIDPNLTIRDLRSLDSQVSGNFTEERLLARLTTLFGILALILACVGLYGVTAYFVARRTSEIGVRMALGASRGIVVSMVLRDVMIQIALGLALGIPSALLVGHFMASQLYEVGAYNPLAFLAATVSLAICASFAGYIPARRAASIDPMQALRIE